MLEKDYFINQLNDILKEYTNLIKQSSYDDLSDLTSSIEVSSLLAKSTSAIQRVVGINSEYYKSIKFAYEEKRLYYTTGQILTYVVGIVKSLKEDLSNDYLKSLSEIIHADVFSDYLEMAQHLLDEGYKNPAAVISGTTLENHLKKLCLKNNIDLTYLNKAGKTVNKTTDKLNSELSILEIYNKMNKTRITALFQLRNSAAHGNYEEYNDNDVKQMITEIQHFMLNYPA